LGPNTGLEMEENIKCLPLLGKNPIIQPLVDFAMPDIKRNSKEFHFKN
jgi:hypothetical protein